MYSAPGMGFAVYPTDMNTGLGQKFVPITNIGKSQLDETFASLDYDGDSVWSNNYQAGMATVPARAPILPPALAPALAQPPAPVPPAGPTLLHRCRSCNKRFKRSADLLRHRNTVHQNARGHLCPIAGCSKSQGIGYSRADKVTELLWRKHADLGYVRA